MDILKDYQEEAVSRMKNGCILCGGVGSGKSRVSLAYYRKVCEEENNYIPFVTYQLGVILAAYREFSDRVKVVTESTRKPNRVRDIIHGHLGKITKTEIMKKCPDISQVTVQRALNDLVTSGEILKIGGGRYTAYTWNHGKE